MVHLRCHARDAASLAPPHGAPTLDLLSPTTRSATDSQLGADLDCAAGHREPTLGLSAHPRGAAAPWLSCLGQLHRQGPARQRPPAGTTSNCQVHDLAVIPTSPGSRHRGLRLPHRGHRVPATALRAVLHPAAHPARPPRRCHRQPHRCLGSPSKPATFSAPAMNRPPSSGS
jgi:hypothetical protein